MRKLSGIFEGILNDIAKRDIMGKPRKQDDINRLGIKEFEEYFRNHYERIYGGTDIEIQKITSGKYPYEIIIIPVIIFDYFEPGKQEWKIYGEFDEKDKLHSVFFIINKDDFERICGKYPELKKLDDYFMTDTRIYTTYKGHRITNKDFLDVIDLCIPNSDHKIWKKK